jgi:hypothetical protein
VGKTHLAVALGVRAVENGFSVAFHRLEDLLAGLKRDAEVGPQRLRRRKHMNVALLVIDEVGFEPMTRPLVLPPSIRFGDAGLFELVSSGDGGEFSRGSKRVASS